MIIINHALHDVVRVAKYTCYGYCKNQEGRVVECDKEEISEGQFCSKCGEFKTDVIGDIIYIGKYFVTVQGKNYAECFLNIDIRNGDYKIEPYEGRRKFAGKKNRKQVKLGFA